MVWHAQFTQLMAVSKCAGTHAGHTVRYCDISQIVAKIKSRTSYCLQAFWKVDGGQSATAVKRSASNRLNGAGFFPGFYLTKL